MDYLNHIGKTQRRIFSLFILLLLSAGKLIAGHQLANHFTAFSADRLSIHVTSSIDDEKGHDPILEASLLPETIAEIPEVENEDDESVESSSLSHRSLLTLLVTQSFPRACLEHARSDRKLFVLFHCWRSFLF